jgi:CYTH domain-containing protein
MTEIEKKFLIYENDKSFATKNLNEICSSIDALKEKVLKEGTKIQQGYIPIEKGMELAKKLGLHVTFEPAEARLRNKGGKYFFTIKGEGGTVRDELEVTIDQHTFQHYWSATEGKRVEKMRLKTPYEGQTAEVDVYLDRKLIVAEVEVGTLDEAERLKALGKDVTKDKAYKNKNLAK